MNRQRRRESIGIALSVIILNGMLFLSFGRLAGGIARSAPVLASLNEPAQTLSTIRASFLFTDTLTATPTLSGTLVSTPGPTQTQAFLPSATPTPFLTESTATPTVPPTPTITPIITVTATPTISLSIPAAAISSTVFLPVINRSIPIYIPATKSLFCDHLSSSLAIPDDNSVGVNNMITISDPSQIVDLDIALDINHPWVGDLRVKLQHQNTGKTITLIDRPGVPQTPLGCGYPNIKTILDDDISSSVANKCAQNPAAISGIYIPETALNAFKGENITGNWILNVSDHSVNDVGRLNAWCLVATISIAPPPPTPAPPPPSFPTQRILSGVTGQAQALPLDCESRSAVDWAHYFGKNIGELTFFNHLPVSDNPDKGFVGDVYGQWGQIPPNPYGVHAEPVASLLRQYNVQAYAHRPLSWDGLRAEVGAGRPVMVWIVASVLNGIPIYITPSDGLHTVVARFEHTVVVTGYTASSVYFLNGGTIYQKSVSEFLDSWSAMGNMAITASQ